MPWSVTAICNPDLGKSHVSHNSLSIDCDVFALCVTFYRGQRDFSRQANFYMRCNALLEICQIKNVSADISKYQI